MAITGFAVRKATIVFDLDGTLLDTAPDLINAVNHVLEMEGGRPVDASVLRPVISGGGRALLKSGLQKNGLDYSEAELSRLLEHFIAHYRENIAVLSKPFPGLIAELDRLAVLGCKLCVCTNKLEELAWPLLAALELTERFDAITGRDTFPVYKPDPRHLLGTIARCGGDPTHAVMLGDSNTDVKTAKAAGIPVIGVTFGYTDIPIAELGCDAVISHYDQLPDALAGLGIPTRHHK
ncbi:MAG: phosphoglycolate phosphatase [Pseudomonadota bacterium]